MAGTAWNVFTPNTRAYSSRVNENFDWLEGNFVPMNGGTKTNNTYDLGESSFRWKDLYVKGSGYIETLRVGDQNTPKAYLSEYPLGTNPTSIIFGGLNNATSISFIVNSSTVSTLSQSGASFLVGATINEYSIDGTLSGNSDNAVPTEKAVKSYVDGLHAGTSIFGIGTGTLTSGTISAFSISGGYFTAPTAGTYEFVLHIQNNGVNAVTTNSSLRIGLHMVSSSGALFMPSSAAEFFSAVQVEAVSHVSGNYRQSFQLSHVMSLSSGNVVRPLIDLGSSTITTCGNFSCTKSFFSAIRI